MRKEHLEVIKACFIQEKGTSNLEYFWKMKKQNRNLKRLECVGRTCPCLTLKHKHHKAVWCEGAGSPAAKALLLPKPHFMNQWGEQKKWTTVCYRSWRWLKRKIFCTVTRTNSLLTPWMFWRNGWGCTWNSLDEMIVLGSSGPPCTWIIHPHCTTGLSIVPHWVWMEYTSSL